MAVLSRLFFLCSVQHAQTQNADGMESNWWHTRGGVRVTVIWSQELSLSNCQEVQLILHILLLRSFKPKFLNFLQFSKWRRFISFSLAPLCAVFSFSASSLCSSIHFIFHFSSSLCTSSFSHVSCSLHGQAHACTHLLATLGIAIAARLWAIGAFQKNNRTKRKGPRPFHSCPSFYWLQLFLPVVARGRACLIR